MEKHLATKEALQTEAQDFARSLKSTEGHAFLVTLSGELGAGKTTFTQGMAEALGITESVTSPTFVLEKVYALTAQTSPFVRFVHIDAYRLTKGNDLEALGFGELIKDPQTLIVLEWPERVADGLPPADVKIALTVEGEGELSGRTITYV